jgi:hypothetical protein
MLFVLRQLRIKQLDMLFVLRQLRFKQLDMLFVLRYVICAKTVTV